MIKLAYNKANSNLVFKIDSVIRTSMAGGIVEYYKGTLVDTSTVPDTETPGYRVQVMGFESDWLLVPTDIGGTSGVNNQDKTVNPSTSEQTIVADTGYTGLSSVTVNAVTAAIDSNITAGNIKSGVTILGTEGSVVELIGETAEVTPSITAQTITPVTGNGITEVSVNAVDNTIDANIVAGNIKKDVTILGVTGTLEAAPAPSKLGLTITSYTDYVNKTTYGVKVNNYFAGDIDVENLIVKGIYYNGDSSANVTVPVNARVSAYSTSTNTYSIDIPTDSQGMNPFQLVLVGYSLSE